MKALLPLALAVALAAAPAAAGATTLVSFAQSGGLAGSRVTVSVTSTGHAAVDANGHDRSHRLRASSLQRLRRLLAAVPFDRVNPGRSRCADCFGYVVRYRGRRFAYDDSQMAQVPRSARAVVAEMLRIARWGR